MNKVQHISYSRLNQTYDEYYIYHEMEWEKRYKQLARDGFVKNLDMRTTNSQMILIDKLEVLIAAVNEIGDRLP